ncbi:MAG: metal ABC transporter permease [Candidatus Syntropharchaeia archaeon]
MFEYPFMQWAFIAAIVTGTICSVMGVFVILKGLTFMGGGMVHASFAGAALAILLETNFLINADPIPFALLFGILSALLTGYLNEKGGIKLDVAIGVLFALTMALGILFIGLMRQYSTDVYGILFGDILSVGRDLTILISVFGFFVLFITFLFFKEFLFIVFDQEMAEACGIPTRKLFYLLLTLVAITIGICLKSVGALLVLALIVTPAAAAHQLTHDIRKMVGISVVFGIISSVGGLFLSYFHDLPSGPMIVIIASIFFFASFLISPKRKRLKSVQERQ